MIGESYRRNGEWCGRQVLASNWVKESTTARHMTNCKPGIGYGYLWWVDPSERAYFAGARALGTPGTTSRISRNGASVCLRTVRPGCGRPNHRADGRVVARAGTDTVGRLLTCVCSRRTRGGAQVEPEPEPTMRRAFAAQTRDVSPRQDLVDQ